MSSILDALNKLEQERSTQDLPVKQAAPLNMAFRIGSIVPYVMIACIALGSIGMWAYYRASSPAPTVTLPKNETRASKTDTPAAPLPDPSEDSPAPPPSSLPPVSAPAKLESPASTNVLPQGLLTDSFVSEQLPVVQEADAPEATSAAPTKTETIVSAGSDPLSDKGSQESAASSAAPSPRIPSGSGDPTASKQEKVPGATSDLPGQTASRKEEPQVMDKLAGSGFAIQAISWGEDPADRLAVINNQVLREGDGIEGYQISRINPDDIVLSRGGKKWRLDFGLK